MRKMLLTQLLRRFEMKLYYTIKAVGVEEFAVQWCLDRDVNALILDMHGSEDYVDVKPRYIELPDTFDVVSLGISSYSFYYPPAGLVLF